MGKALALLLICLALPLWAAPEDRALAAWKSWANTAGIQKTTIAVLQNGNLVAREGKGIKASSAMTLASMSKAVTGACIAALIGEGKLKANTPLSAVLGAEAGLRGKATVSGLLTQTAGLWPDQTQRLPPAWWRGTSTKHREVTENALERSKTRKGFRYNNENYAVLGRVIEKVTGQSYTSACRARLGLKGFSLSPRWASAGAFGGLRANAADYARFVHQQFGPRSRIGKAPNRWPSTGIKDGARYGMGTFYRASKDGPLFWHAGLLCSTRRNGGGGYFASYGGTYVVVVLFDGCIKGKHLIALDNTLYRAVLR